MTKITSILDMTENECFIAYYFAVSEIICNFASHIKDFVIRHIAHHDY